MKDKKNLVAIILLILAVGVVIITAIFTKGKKEQPDINIVTNYSNFYTVTSCLSRIITYITEKDNDSLILVLSENYKNENNITKENVLSYFDIIETDSSFISKKMYYEDLNKNITKYYVYGYVEKNQLFDEQFYTKLDIKDIYFIVYLDKESKTFSIEPYSGDIFKDGDIDE